MPTDLDKLQGSWRVTALEVDGQAVPELAFNAARVVVDGDRFTSLGMGATYEGRVELRAGRAFDLLFTKGPERGNRNLGIYTLRGNRWQLCLATRGDKRPRGFATKAGSGLALQTLVREEATTSVAKKPAKKPSTRGKAAASPAIEAGSGPKTELEGDWQMVSGVFGGKALEPGMVAYCKRITRGDVTTVVAGPQQLMKMRFTIGREAEPHQLDYENLAGPNAGKRQAGIFRISDGELAVCVAAPGKPRPRDFASKKGDGRSFTVWRLP